MLLFYISLIEDKDDIVTFERIFDDYKDQMYRVAMKVLKDHLSLAIGLLQLIAYGTSLFLEQDLSAGLAAQMLIESILFSAACSVSAAMGQRWNHGAESLL